ncbi:MAG: efflux RND transporter periplasmic adaptor subunit [Treponema sp.]|nr:efflux RND transporter periplasmic adaptor subunit [Treponema sp.]
MTMEMKKKSRIALAVVLGTVTALNIVFRLVTGNGDAANEATAAPATVFTVRTEYAEIRTLQAHLEVNANIVSTHQVAVLPDTGGRLVSMRAGLGSMVQSGAIIAEVDPSRPGAVFSLSPVRAPVSGMVVSSPLPVGSTVGTGTVLMTIAVGGNIEIEARIPEREVGQLRTGLSAEVRLEAFPSETFAATVTQVSPVLDPVSRTRQITMRFNQNDPRISSGMFARVRLNTRTYENVISIPQQALTERRGATVVYVLQYDPDGVRRVEMREVVVGVNVDGETEIRSGLEPGEAVVVQGQQFLADGAPVRVLGRGL